jgi:CzcA family heavy metal efflux pump
VSIAAWAARHRAGVLLATAMLTILGINAAATLPAGIYPEATFPRIAIVVQGGTFEPADMIVAVTRPIEESLSGVIDLRKIRSRTVRGGAELSLEFRPGSDMQFGLQQVQARLATLGPTLPADLKIVAERLTPSVFPMLQYEITGGNPVLLLDLARLLVRPRLAHLPDVGEVSVQGGLVREISVVLDPTRLASNRLSVTDVADRIRASNVVVAAGRIDQTYLQYGVIVSGLAGTPEAVGDLVMRDTGDRAVRVSDLGSVSYGTEDRFQIAAGNGQPAALINVSRQPAGNTLAVERAVSAAIDSLKRQLPAGITIHSVYDQGTLVRGALASVSEAMGIGCILAVVVLLLFLGRVRITAIAAATIPLSIAGTFAGLKLAGDSLNLMSLGGLAVAIGLIIDDAVVVVDNIERRIGLAPGVPLAETVRTATDEILRPVASSTLTTVVVFAPLTLIEGVVGQFFRSFSLALCIAVLLSLVYAVVLIPMLSSRALQSRTGERGAARRLRPLSLERVEAAYLRLVRSAQSRPRIALAAGLLLSLSAVGLGRFVATGFMPDIDEGGFVLDYWMPAGTSLAETDRQIGMVERILREDPGVEAFTRRTGAELGFFATAPNRGDMTVRLKLRRERASVYEVIARLRGRIESQVPAMRVEFVQILQDLIGDLAATPEPIEIKLFHQNVPTAEAAARSVAGAIEKVPGLEDLFDGVYGPLPELQVVLDPVRVSRVGLTEREVGAQARAALFGEAAGEVREPDRLVPIRVRVPDSVRFDPGVVSSLPIVGPTGWSTLGALGRVRDTLVASELLRESLMPVVRVTGSVDLSTSDLGSVMRGIRSALASLPLPPGVRLEYGGQYAGQQASFRQLLAVLCLAAGAVLLVMVWQFGSFRGPLAILCAVPLGVTGAVVALLLTGVPFNVSSFMGLILLVGLIVKNGIIMLDAAKHLVDGGMKASDAVIEAGRIRMRPILMTTLCTLAGLIPLALGLGTGAELQRPLAIAVIGGLALSTTATLILLPVALQVLQALGPPPVD